MSFKWNGLEVVVAPDGSRMAVGSEWVELPCGGTISAAARATDGSGDLLVVPRGGQVRRLAGTYDPATWHFRSVDTTSQYERGIDERAEELAADATRVNPKAARAIADGKDPLDYLEPALEGPLSRVMKHGADKYGYRNYTGSAIDVRTYIGAVRRHTNALARGEDVDPDSGESHWAHIAACCAVVEGARNVGMLRDNRGANVIAAC